MSDVFTEFNEAAEKFATQQTYQAFKDFEKAGRKAEKTFEYAKIINGGEKIRIPIEFEEAIYART